MLTGFGKRRRVRSRRPEIRRESHRQAVLLDRVLEDRQQRLVEHQAGACAQTTVFGSSDQATRRRAAPSCSCRSGKLLRVLERRVGIGLAGSRTGRSARRTAASRSAYSRQSSCTKKLYRSEFISKSGSPRQLLKVGVAPRVDAAARVVVGLDRRERVEELQRAGAGIVDVLDVEAELVAVVGADVT